MTGASYWPGPPLVEVSYQPVVGRYVDSILYAPIPQRLANLRFAKDAVGAQGHLLAQLPLPLDLRRLEFFVSGNLKLPKSGA